MLPDEAQPAPEVEGKEPGGMESNSAHFVLYLNDSPIHHLGFLRFPLFLDQTSSYDAVLAYAFKLKSQVSLAPITLPLTNQWPMLNVFFFILL